MTAIAEHLDLALPGLPDALQGLRIAHITDLHIRRPRKRHWQIVDELTEIRPDLIFFTGDYIEDTGDEPAAIQVMQRMCEQLDPPLGMFGVFGNHDTQEVRRSFATLPIHWLNNDRFGFDNLPLELLGIDTAHVNKHHDSLALIERMSRHNGHPPVPHGAENVYELRSLRLLLCHVPDFLPTAADLEMDVMFSGHTHGGQMRLPGGRALINSSHLPLELSSGLLLHNHTVCAISRGLGEAVLPIRLFCRAQLPIYTLRNGARAGVHTHHVHNAFPW